jgi:hypothetical protein
MSNEKTIVGIFLGTEGKRKGRQPKREAKLLEKLEIDGAPKQIVLDPHWKPNLIEACRRSGYEVRAVSVLQHRQKGCDIAVTVVEKQGGKLSLRGKPVTRGGKPITGPVTGKTMAERRRNR